MSALACESSSAGANTLPLQVLSKYRSGKLPKAFKIIPALSNWEQVLYLTEPETWTAAAMYQATRSEVTVHGPLRMCQCLFLFSLTCAVRAGSSRLI